MKKLLFVIAILCSLCIAACKKTTNSGGGCTIPAIVPLQPYSFPVWHPNGQLLGFNHTPLSGIGANGNFCTWYSYWGKSDSTGFYIMNKNGSGFKRITRYNIFAPAWSPDGKWLAFNLPDGQIYKMAFTGSNFDTANLIRLTNGGGNFHPSWTPNSDTIYYDSNIGTNGQGYYVWKMAADGTGQTEFPNTGREPFVGSDNMVYYSWGEVFFMNKDGTNKTQFSNNGFGVSYPKFWQGRVFYNNGNIGVINGTGTKGVQLISPADTYDISINGEIVYSKMEYDIMKYNEQIGTLWIMNADGSNNRQLTFNNF